MKKLLSHLLICMQLFPVTAWSAGRIQNEDVKTLTELTNAGGSASQLINDSKIYVTANGINSQLSTAISSGLIGSSGSKNFIINSAIESSTTGYASFKDAASVVPVDGTGGSPTHITFSRTTSSPLAGSGSLLISNSGSSSAQGEGVSYDFSIDNSAQAHTLSVSFDYQLVSGTFQAGSDPSGLQSDLEVYLYDFTNGLLIQPTTYKLYCSSTAVPCTYQGFFPSSASSTSYRAILYVPTTNTAAWSLKMDSIFVGSSNGTSVNGSPVAFKAIANAAQSIPGTSFTQLTNFGTTQFDTASGFDGSGSYKVPVSGVYLVGAGAEFAASNARFIVRPMKNGSEITRYFDATLPSGGNVTVSGSTLVQCNAGDLLTIEVFQTSGTVNVNGSTTTHFDVSLVPGASAGGSALLGKAPTIQKFTSGSGTYTLPTNPQPSYIRVRMVGAGGGGGGSTQTSVNDGGTGGTGGDTTFGPLTANGGAGGNTSTQTAGSGGSASLGSGPIGTALSGGGGGSPSGRTEGSVGNFTWLFGGIGGSSAFGGAGKGENFPSGSAFAAPANGGGGGSGGGAGGTNGNGSKPGPGGGSGGFVDAIISGSTLVSTMSYSVGSGGAGGTAPTTGNPGSDGGSGYIEVTEYYASSGGLSSSDEKIYLQYTGNAGTSLTANTTNLDFSTKVVDSHGAWSGTVFTAFRPGWFNLNGSVNLSARVNLQLYLYKNGTQNVIIAGPNSNISAFASIIQFNGSIYLNAGDTLSIRSDTNATLSNSSTAHWIGIHSQ